MKSTTMLAVLAGSCILLSGCQTPRTTANAWEYKVVEKALYPGQLEQQLNELAGGGWSLVTVSTAYQGESTVPKGFIVVRRPKVQ